MTAKTISDEHVLFDIIRRKLDYGSALPFTGAESLDDCAIIPVSETSSLAITSDFVRGSGFYLFRMGLMDYYDVGYYLISANLSDLASVGAKPLGLTTIVRYGENMGDTEFEAVFSGMRDSADRYHVPIVGGDIGSYNSDVFAATAFGTVDNGTALLRRNVQKGDLLCMTGIAGRAVTAQLYIKDAKPKGFILTPDEENILIDAWRKPPACIKEGLLLRERKLGHACQDVSDGLKGTIEQMAALSGHNFTVYADRIPIHELTRRVATALDSDPIQIAMSASVDFELLFTISPDKQQECEKAFQEQGFTMSIIGETNSEGQNILVDADGSRRPLPGQVWKQQAGTDFLKGITGKS